jgi:hypothetical protein
VPSLTAILPEDDSLNLSQRLRYTSGDTGDDFQLCRNSAAGVESEGIRLACGHNFLYALSSS